MAHGIKNINDMMNLEESKKFLRDHGIDPDEVAEDGRRYGKALKQYAEAVRQNEPIGVVRAREKALREVLTLNREGNAGIMPDGKIVDKRKHDDAQEIPENKSLGIAKPS